MSTPHSFIVWSMKRKDIGNFRTLVAPIDPEEYKKTHKA